MKNQLVWALGLFVLLLVACKAEAPSENGASTTTTDTTAAVAPVEFADAKYAETVKNGLAAFEKGDIASWLALFSDNAVYVWNNGDSLAGKAAISEYWTKRWTDVIESINYENEIFLPIKVNTPQSVEAPGVWVLTWFQTTAKYKTSGKTMTQWMHNDSHFDANGKIDRMILYSDRALINDAMTK